jgi:hypothetical protein
MNNVDSDATNRHVDKKPLIAVAREAVQTAEDAREIAVKKMGEVRLANERQNAADAQALSQSQADDATRQKNQAESDTAAALAAKTQAQSDAAAALAARNQADADTATAQAAKAQAESDAARARNEATDGLTWLRTRQPQPPHSPRLRQMPTNPVWPHNRRRPTRRPCERNCPSS